MPSIPVPESRPRAPPRCKSSYRVQLVIITVPPTTALQDRISLSERATLDFQARCHALIIHTHRGSFLPAWSQSPLIIPCSAPSSSLNPPGRSQASFPCRHLSQLQNYQWIMKAFLAPLNFFALRKYGEPLLNHQSSSKYHKKAHHSLIVQLVGI